MKRRYYIIGAVIIAAAFLLGLDGVQLADKSPADNLLGDRLIGAFVTTEYLDLFDIEAYLNANAGKLAGGGNIAIGPGEGQEYQGRIYAELVEKTMTREDGTERRYKEYVFTELEGFYGYCPTMRREATEDMEEHDYIDNISGSGMEIHLHSKHIDGRSEMEIKGTLHIAVGSGDRAFYVNPVFQDNEGRVYLTSGHGMQVSSNSPETAGELWHVNHSSTHTETVDGESVSSTNSVEITLKLVHPTEVVSIAVMDKGHKLLKSYSYPTEFAPEELKLFSIPGAEYLIMESVGEDGKVLDRAVYGPEDENAGYYEPLESGVCDKRTMKLLWKNAGDSI